MRLRHEISLAAAAADPALAARVDAERVATEPFDAQPVDTDDVDAEPVDTPPSGCALRTTIGIEVAGYDVRGRPGCAAPGRHIDDVRIDAVRAGRYP